MKWLIEFATVTGHSGAGINIPNPKTNAVLRSGGDVPPSTIISPQPSTRNQTQEPVNNEKSLSENFQVIKVSFFSLTLKEWIVLLHMAC